MNAIEALNTFTQFPEEIADKFAANLTSLGSLRLLAIGLRLAPNREAVELVDAFLHYRAVGMPVAAFEAALDDAQWHAWACTATERKAYVFAHFLAMPKAHKIAFLDYVKQRFQEESCVHSKNEENAYG